MEQSFARCLALTAALAACGGRPSAKTSPEAAATLDAAFSCAVGAVREAGYRVSKDDRSRVVRGFIREDAAADPSSLGGTVGGQGSRRNVGDVDAPYEVDGVDATVSLDRDGDVKIDAEAYTGAGASSKSGYVKRGASARGASTVKRVEGCAR
jgi:hypothetical protein